MPSKQRSVRERKGRLFLFLSALIGFLLAVLQAIGAFAWLDGLLSGTSDPATGPDGILTVLLLSIVPAALIVRLGSERGILASLGILALYYLAAWLLWRANAQTVPLAAPAIATALALVRGLGWTPVLSAPTRSDGRERTGRKAAFISYRREGGAEIARLINSELQARGYECFLDVEDLGASHFDERLLREIERAPNFILVLSRGALEGCSQPGDWLHRELSHAIATSRNIVPVLLEAFDFSALPALPEDIRELPRYNSVLYSHAYFSATIDKLTSFLREEHGRGER